MRYSLDGNDQPEPSPPSPGRLPLESITPPLQLPYGHPTGSFQYCRRHKPFLHDEMTSHIRPRGRQTPFSTGTTPPPPERKGESPLLPSTSLRCRVPNGYLVLAKLRWQRVSPPTLPPLSFSPGRQSRRLHLPTSSYEATVNGLGGWLPCASCWAVHVDVVGGSIWLGDSLRARIGRKRETWSCRLGRSCGHMRSFGLTHDVKMEE